MYERSTIKDDGLKNKIINFYKDIADTDAKKAAVIKISDCIICCAQGMMGSPAMITDKVVEEFKDALEFLSDGINTVIPDDRGIPSIMVKVEKYSNNYLDMRYNHETHPAFLINGSMTECIYVSKYQNFTYEGRGYSLPFTVPSVGMDLEESVKACIQKGKGWNLSYYALRAAIALKASKQGFLPRGNTNKGHDYFHKEEKGNILMDGLVETGSGPEAWSHDKTVFGIYDLCGNLNEWDTGLRLKNGEIQIVPDGNSLMDGCDYSDSSKWWRAIMPDGSLVMPGCKGTLKYNNHDGRIIMTASNDIITDTSFGCALKDIKSDKETKIPDLVKQLALYPISEQWDYGYGWRWANTNGEFAPLSGGAYLAEDHAGIYFTGMTYPRTQNYKLAGFRAVYVNQKSE